MYQKKRNIKKFRLVIIVGISLILITSSIIFIRDERVLNFLEKMTKDGTLFISNIILTPVNYITDKIDEMGEKNDLYENYKLLEEKASGYDALLAEKEELKKVVEVNNLLSDKKVMNAVVINRNLDYWHDTITIDKGSNDGIVEGMPVVVSEGLIGRISSTSNFNSTVKLLTGSNNHKISVKVQSGDDYAYGLLSGYDEKNDIYVIEGISQTVSIENDSLVTTTGFGDIFPSGLVIGKVVSFKTDNYGLSTMIEVKPSVNFNDFSVVTVIKRNVDA